MTNNRILNFLLNVLQVFMQMCVAVCVVNIFLHGFMGYEKFQVLNTLYIGIVILIFYLSKTCVKHGKLSFMIHLAAVVSILFVVQGELEDKMLVMIPGMTFCYYSMKKKDESPFFPLDMGILAACYVMGSTIRAESGTVIPFYCTIIYIVAFLIWYNIRNLNLFVMENGAVKSFNAEQAVNVNSVMLAIYILLCAAVMFIMPVLHVQDAVSAVLRGMWNIFLAGFHALNIQMPEGGYELEHSMQNKTEESAEDFGHMLEMSEGNDILDLIAVIFAAVIFACLMLLVIKSLKDLRYKKIQGTDVKEFVKPVLKREHSGIKTKKPFLLMNVSNDIAARKIYKNIIYKNLKKGNKVDQTNTPKEISEAVIGWNESSAEITDIYEKARYGIEKISNEEVETLRKARKNIK